MNKITKAEFKNIITHHYSKFFMAEDKAFADNVLHDGIMASINSLKQITTRFAKLDGVYVLFNDGSRLNVANSRYTEYECYCYAFEFGRVLAVEEKWYDNWDNTYRYKTLYYMLIE